MSNEFYGSLHGLSRKICAKSRSICAENFTGEKGKAGMATEGTGAGCARELGQGWKISPSVVVAAGTTFTLADVSSMGEIRHIWITDSAPSTRLLVFRAYWDGSDIPSIEVPLEDFFAYADKSTYKPVNSLPVCVNPRQAYNCYWSMPFRKGFRMTIENLHTEDITVYYQIDYLEMDVPEDACYFHAQFRRVNPLPYKEVYTILDNIHGRGQYVGTYLYWGVHNKGWWGEGEIKFYLDGDKEYPTICGTGTEDYFCGSYNFDIGGKYQEFTTAYAGLARVGSMDGLYNSQERFSMYRWHVTDPICFEEDLKVTIQALGWRSGGRYLPLQDDISSVAFWYQDTICGTFPELPDANGLEII